MSLVFVMVKYLLFGRERERREKEKERVFVKERDDHDNDASQLHPLFSPSLAKKNSKAPVASHFYAQKQTNSMSAIQFSARAAVAPKISLRKSSKVSVRTGVRAQAVAARKW